MYMYLQYIYIRILIFHVYMSIMGFRVFWVKLQRALQEMDLPEKVSLELATRYPGFIGIFAQSCIFRP